MVDLIQFRFTLGFTRTDPKLYSSKVFFRNWSDVRWTCRLLSSANNLKNRRIASVYLENFSDHLSIYVKCQRRRYKLYVIWANAFLFSEVYITNSKQFFQHIIINIYRQIFVNRISQLWLTVTVCRIIYINNFFRNKKNICVNWNKMRKSNFRWYNFTEIKLISIEFGLLLPLIYLFYLPFQNNNKKWIAAIQICSRNCKPTKIAIIKRFRKVW